AAFLRTHLHPGDSVQPLDWVNGAEHGMLLARAPVATRFVHEYQFFHDVDDPLIQSLRREFIAGLNRVQPRFIIDVYEGRPYVSGPGTDNTFPELDALIAQHYHHVSDGNGFVIDERNSTW
ncbi:MAG: hypothetical protein QOH79_558, partial [Acidimicrobiaceae bacterium]